MQTKNKSQAIVYYSYSGNNRLLAECLSRETGIPAIAIQETKKRNALRIALDVFLNRVPSLRPLPISLQGLDHVIFIAPLWNGKIASPLRALLLDVAGDVKSYSFVTLCGGYEKKGQLTTVRRQLIELLGREPISMKELDVSDLLPVDVRKKVRTVSGYHVQPSDLQKGFRSTIDEIESELRH